MRTASVSPVVEARQDLQKDAWTFNGDRVKHKQSQFFKKLRNELFFVFTVSGICLSHFWVSFGLLDRQNKCFTVSIIRPRAPRRPCKPGPKRRTTTEPPQYGTAQFKDVV